MEEGKGIQPVRTARRDGDGGGEDEGVQGRIYRGWGGGEDGAYQVSRTPP